MMEYYSALKRKETTGNTTAWMNLEDIMLSEISQSQNANDSTYRRYLVQIHRDRK